MMINPQWLRSFATLAELGNFTRTAERLDLTQAAVSQHIRQLENQLGPLLIRKPRGIELMPSGHALLAYCQELQQAGHRLQCRLQQDEAHQGVIGLISPGSIGLRLYPLLLDLQQANPGLCVHHRFAPDSEVLSAVLDNRYELGLLSYRPDDPRLLASLFAEEPLELVLPARVQIDSWQDLDRLGFIDHPDSQAMAGRLLARCFPGSPSVRSLRCSGFSNQIGLILEPVARGLGFSVLPRPARQAFRQQHLVRVHDCQAAVVDQLWLIQRAEWPLSARAVHAVQWLRQHMTG